MKYFLFYGLTYMSFFFILALWELYLLVIQYQGKWNLFDQIVMTPNFLNKNNEKDFSNLKYWKHQIFRRDYLFQETGSYKGNTKRTTAGGVWLDGYSDHLPVVVYLMKEQK